jgi:hypothetical protein
MSTWWEYYKLAATCRNAQWQHFSVCYVVTGSIVWGYSEYSVAYGAMERGKIHVLNNSQKALLAASGTKLFAETRRRSQPGQGNANVGTRYACFCIFVLPQMASLRQSFLIFLSFLLPHTLLVSSLVCRFSYWIRRWKNRNQPRQDSFKEGRC